MKAMRSALLAALFLALTTATSSNAASKPEARCAWIFVKPVLWYHNGEFLCPSVCPSGYMCCAGGWVCVFLA